MITYELLYPKCALTGRMIFPGDSSVLGHDGRIYSDDVARALSESDSTEIDVSLVEPWLSRSELEADPNADPITLEVIRGALRSIWTEMQFTMTRTAYSPIFFEGEDFTVTILDPDLQIVSTREGFPSQMGAMQQSARAAIAPFGWENIEPGDVLLHNASHIGTPHLPEFCMAMPVFRDGRLVAVVETVAHHADVGGKSPGGMPGDATDIHQEGVIIPPVKFFSRGEPDSQLWRLVLSNTRTPESSYGDFMAMYGSLVTGSRRLNDLFDRYGTNESLMYMKELQKYSERRTRACLRAVPNGVYEAEIHADDDGVTNESYPIRLRMTVLDEDVILDFRESAPQASGPINNPYTVTLAASVNALFNVLDHDIPHNEGAFRPIHLIAPPGTIVNCDYPAALSSGNTETHNLVAEVVIGALRKAVPDRVAAPTGATTGLITGGGVHPELDEFYAFVIWEPTGYGARLHQDGYTNTTWVAPQARQFSTEVLETKLPWRVVEYSLRRDSGGAGRTRGGLGVTRTYEMLASEQVVNSIAHFHRFPPKGVGGGHDGLPTEIRIINEEGVEATALERSGSARSPAKFTGLPVQRGERITVRLPGGAGWGPPGERETNRVEDDLRNEFISKQAAVSLYGLSSDTADDIESRFSWSAKREAHKPREDRELSTQ